MIQKSKRRGSRNRQHPGSSGRGSVAVSQPLTPSRVTVDQAHNVAQVGAAQVGKAQVGTGQVGAAQVSAEQVGAAQVGMGQVGAAQVGMGQVGAAQVGMG